MTKKTAIYVGDHFLHALSYCTYLNCVNNFKLRAYKLLIYILHVVAQNRADCGIVSQTAMPSSLRPISMAHLPIV